MAAKKAPPRRIWKKDYFNRELARTRFRKVGGYRTDYLEEERSIPISQMGLTISQVEALWKTHQHEFDSPMAMLQSMERKRASLLPVLHSRSRAPAVPVAPAEKRTGGVATVPLLGQLRTVNLPPPSSVAPAPKKVPQKTKRPKPTTMGDALTPTQLGILEGIRRGQSLVVLARRYHVNVRELRRNYLASLSTLRKFEIPFDPVFARFAQSTEPKNVVKGDSEGKNDSKRAGMRRTTDPTARLLRAVPITRAIDRAYATIQSQLKDYGISKREFFLEMAKYATEFTNRGGIIENWTHFSSRGARKVMGRIRESKRK